MASEQQSKIKKTSATEKKFQSLGLNEPSDFLFHLPLRYEDRSRIHTIHELQIGQQAQIEGVVSQVEAHYHGRKQLTAYLKDSTASIKLRWLHFYPSQKKQLENKGLIRVRGEVRGSLQWGLEIIHPNISKAGEPLTKHLIPIYPTTQGLNQKSLYSAIKKAFNTVTIKETLPQEILQEFKLLPLEQALQIIHYPALDISLDSLIYRTHPAWERLKFDEILAQQLAMQIARDERQKYLSYPIKIIKESFLAKHVLKQFSFDLTTAQQRVINEIHHDLNLSFPMHRLIQGDVGSGKTIIAALAAARVLEEGYQVAVMAPTEILAEQHFLKLKEWFQGTKIQLTWLTGQLKNKEKKQIEENIQNGQAHLVIGTQALIQKNINFKNLALIILDEQHRFGVGQRLELSKKGENHFSADNTRVPHQLNMSATPIPRTLAMTFLADLDVSVIDELPPGRQTIQTKLLNNERRPELLTRVRNYCATGQQVYWVCPLVEESEALQLETAEATFELLKEELADLNIGLIHGRLNAEEKAAAMDQFLKHQIDILVATTVIEVGVDIPNANLIIIEHAERFGLSQLHQLRGRVGRGLHQAFCILLYQTPLSQLATERLKAMYETTDGFEISQRDLAQRGPGEFLGLKQSGMQMMQFADLETDQDLVEKARKKVNYFLEYYPKEANEHIQRWVTIGTDYLRS